jgi:hypothetical protein
MSRNHEVVAGRGVATLWARLDVELKLGESWVSLNEKWGMFLVCSGTEK